MKSRKYCLKWKRNQPSETGVPVQLGIDEATQDVAILCENMCLMAHKAVLAAFSPFFKEQFASNAGGDTVVIQHVRFADLTTVVEFIYRGEVVVPQQQLYTLAKAADTFKVKGRFMFVHNDGSNDAPLSTNLSYSTTPRMACDGLQMPWGFQQAFRNELQSRTGKINASADQPSVSASDDVDSDAADNAHGISLALDAVHEVPVRSTSTETAPAAALPPPDAPSADSFDLLATGANLPATLHHVLESVNNNAKGIEAWHSDTGVNILDAANVQVSMPTEASTPASESRVLDREVSTLDGAKVLPLNVSQISGCSEYKEAALKASFSNICDVEQPPTKLPSLFSLTDNKTTMNDGCASGDAVSNVECSSKVLMTQQIIPGAPVMTRLRNLDSMQQEPTSCPERPSSPSLEEGSSSGSAKTCAECAENVTPLSSTAQLGSPIPKNRKYRSLLTGKERLTSTDEQTEETSWSGPITRSRAARLAKQLK
ncbi:modifier of mdg4-like [Dermacentor albipictus]|uniref:modifier of mdg4-like n=1 Tax=Dermacentor albipictus TaxID=60249 RepID=UPI0031FBAE55